MFVFCFAGFDTLTFFKKPVGHFLWGVGSFIYTFLFYPWVNRDQWRVLHQRKQELHKYLEIHFFHASCLWWLSSSELDIFSYWVLTIPILRVFQNSMQKAWNPIICTPSFCGLWEAYFVSQLSPLSPPSPFFFPVSFFPPSSFSILWDYRLLLLHCFLPLQPHFLPRCTADLGSMVPAG